ncbi:MAG: Fe-S cluster assembly sulfur transfer protein SufU [Pseudomonadota bacterium]
MTVDLADLYQDVIVDHNRSPRNFGALQSPTREAEGFNPLCGDQLKLYLMLDGDVIQDIRFDGSGCAISVASASLMTERLKGATETEAKRLFDTMHQLLTNDAFEADIDDLGKLAALTGVRAYPSRIKCASLCWHALASALRGETAPARTE